MSKVSTNATIVFIAAVLVIGLVLNYVMKKTLKSQAGNEAFFQHMELYKKEGGKLKKKKRKFTSK